jgi:hypothetical protein
MISTPPGRITLNPHVAVGRLLALVFRTMCDGDAGRCGVERHRHELAHRQLFVRGIFHFDAVLRKHTVLHRAVIRQVAQHPILRRQPEAVSAARLPFGLARATELGVKVLEGVFAAGGAVGNDPRANIERDDHLRVLIAQAKVIRPAAEVYVINLHKSFLPGWRSRVRLLSC